MAHAHADTYGATPRVVVNESTGSISVRFGPFELVLSPEEAMRLADELSRTAVRAEPIEL